MDNISYIKFNGCDYLVNLDSKLIGTIHKLIKGGWVGKSHMHYGKQVISKTRKECASKLIRISNMSISLA